jgi:hypothetical protein
VCPICGTKFMPKSNSAICCSVKCSTIRKDIKRQLRPKHEFTCLWCHEVGVSQKYYSPFNPQKFCSCECREKFNRIRDVIYKKWQFDLERSDAELKKLQELGQNYVLEGENNDL